MIGEAGAQYSVPMLINYQGELVGADGSPLPDGPYAMIFRMYDALKYGNLLWEGTYAVQAWRPEVRNGIFSVLLGYGPGNELTPDIFASPETCLEIEVEGETLWPMQQIASVAYAVRAENAHVLQGNPPSAFAPAIHSHFGETWTAPTGTCLTLNGQLGALSGSASASTPAMLYVRGFYGHAENTGAGDAYGGYFSTSKAGTGDHYGLNAYGAANGSSGAYGILSRAGNEGAGEAYGGLFSTDSLGTGVHYGIRSLARAASSSETYGLHSYAMNSGGGLVYGGHFETDEAGTGFHYGLKVRGVASSGMAHGIMAEAVNKGNGPARGLTVMATTTGSGEACAASFYTSGEGTGRHMGIEVTCLANQPSSTWGVEVDTQNAGEGPSFGGYFTGRALGDGECCGLFGRALGGGGKPAYGVQGLGSALGTEPAYGGYFETHTDGFEVHELQGGTSSTSFSYRLVAKRKGYETVRLAVAQLPSEADPPKPLLPDEPGE